MTKSTGRRRTTGGQFALAGFLFQLLRSVQLGLRAALTLDANPDLNALLMLEPERGSDVALHHDDISIFEQVKIRASHRRWSPGAVARDALPDLLKTAKPGTRQRFRFVTDNHQGLASLTVFLAIRLQQRIASPTIRWGNEHLTIEAYEARLAAAAGAEPNSLTWTHLLDNLEIVIVNASAAELEIARRLRPLLASDQSPADMCDALITRLGEAASNGETISAAQLLHMIDRNAERRLSHVNSLPDLARRQLNFAFDRIFYNPSDEARETVITAGPGITVLVAESGQGKTWRLCRTALVQAERGETALLIQSPSHFSDLVDLIRQTLWSPAYPNGGDLRAMADLLGRDMASGRSWLTLYVDDLQDRDLARVIASYDWRSVGIQLVVSCQPRIGTVITGCAPDTTVVTVENFLSTELRRFLRHRGRAAPLETMPDDVFELLQKPIHAKISLELPYRESWTGVTEYELFGTYWKYATGKARGQYDHPTDAQRLMALAGRLLGKRAAYPWTADDLKAVALDDEAILRLEAVGLVQRPDIGLFRFSSDRMLNWAVAEYLAARALKKQWSAEKLAGKVRTLDKITTRDGTQVGHRLGYVFHDLVWLLSKTASSTYIAKLLWHSMRILPQEWRGESRWRALGTIGPKLLPALEVMALRRYDEQEEWDIPLFLPVGILSAGETAPAAVTAVCGRLLGQGDEQAITVALKIGRMLPLPGIIDQIWHIHRARALAFDAFESDPSRDHDSGEIINAYSLSMDALKAAISKAPEWLDDKLGHETEIVPLNQLVWCLQAEKYLAREITRPLWARHMITLCEHLPADSKALIAAIGEFGAIEQRERLDRVSRSRSDLMPARVFKARARMDPENAFLHLAAAINNDAVFEPNWWLPDLARHDAARLSRMILAGAGTSNDPLNLVLNIYSRHPELIDDVTLEWVLDVVADRLAVLNASEPQPHDGLGNAWRGLHLLSSLTEPRQFEAVHRRAGTRLEVELIEAARRRHGRSSRVRDSDGDMCLRVLAMMAGRGYAAITVAELDRPDPLGREDGFTAAHWSEDPSVTAALARLGDTVDSDSYHQVTLMQACAIHCLDNALESMLRAGVPAYLNAAQMRSEGRDTGMLRTRVKELLASGELEIAADLATFLRDADDARMLVPVFVDSTTSTAVRRKMIRTFRALDLYDPNILRHAHDLMLSGEDRERTLTATYLADQGDDDARRAVLDWLTSLECGSISIGLEAVIGGLRAHEWCRPAIIDYLSRSRRDRHLIHDPNNLELLADAGDERARDQLTRAAYREPDAFDTGPVAGILYLQRTDPEEAWFAATRLLMRHGSADAINLLLRIDEEDAAKWLLDYFPRALPSVRAAIARRLRLHFGGKRLAALAASLIEAGHETKQLTAIELGGWIPPGVALEWLDPLCDAPSRTMREAARQAQWQRSCEASAMAHLAAMPASPKALRWARLVTIFELVDPYFLWAREDPAGLQPFIAENNFEFLAEARQMNKKRRREIHEQERKFDVKRSEKYY